MECCHLSLYLIGSAIHSTYPNDIDLAIVYDKKYFAINELILLRKKVCASLFEMLDIEIDLMILSFDEAREVDFWNKEYVQVCKHHC